MATTLSAGGQAADRPLSLGLPAFFSMGTLSSELAPHAWRLSSKPRIYADANVPAGLIVYMRESLQWDVLFVLEEPELRRASDLRHYELARQLRRTLVSLDRDYLDDDRFPPGEGAGVLVLSAPNQREQSLLLERVNRALFQTSEGVALALPLAGRKMHVHTDWGRSQAEELRS